MDLDSNVIRCILLHNHRELITLFGVNLFDELLDQRLMDRRDLVYLVVCKDKPAIFAHNGNV